MVRFGWLMICIAFFMCIDEWDVNNKGKWFEISGHYNQICECTNPKENPAESYQTIFGTLSVSTGKHHWKFKIANMDLTKRAYVRFHFGIVMMNKCHIQNSKINYLKLGSFQYYRIIDHLVNITSYLVLR